MKSIKIGILLLVSILLVGCSTTKENIDPTNIINTLRDNKYEVFDTTEEVGYASTAYYAYKNEIKINFVKATKKYDVQGVFLDECRNIQSVAGGNYKQETDGGKNWTYLIVTNETDYYFVGWVNDSYISISAPIEYTKKINNLTLELGFK